MWEFEFYVMALLSIRLALREGECKKIQISSFYKDLSFVTDAGEVVSLAVKVKVSITSFFDIFLKLV
jgi:hypothetical protein